MQFTVQANEQKTAANPFEAEIGTEECVGVHGRQLDRAQFRPLGEVRERVDEDVAYVDRRGQHVRSVLDRRPIEMHLRVLALILDLGDRDDRFAMERCATRRFTFVDSDLNVLIVERNGQSTAIGIADRQRSTRKLQTRVQLTFDGDAAPFGPLVGIRRLMCARPETNETIGMRGRQEVRRRR